MTAPLRARFALAAASFAGTSFRLHGRDPETGIDCVGHVVLALRACGFAPVSPEGYALRNLDISQWLDFAGRNGFAPAMLEDRDEPGDLLLLRPDPIQAHLAVALAGGALVHAHAGISRVVIECGPPRLPVVRRWRLREEF